MVKVTNNTCFCTFSGQNSLCWTTRYKVLKISKISKALSMSNVSFLRKTYLPLSHLNQSVHTFACLSVWASQRPFPQLWSQFPVFPPRAHPLWVPAARRKFTPLPSITVNVCPTSRQLAWHILQATVISSVEEIIC